MDGPRVVGSRRRIGVPELGQKQLATGGVEAAGISYSSRISTAQLRIFACWGGYHQGLYCWQAERLEQAKKGLSAAAGEWKRKTCCDGKGAIVIWDLESDLREDSYTC